MLDVVGIRRAKTSDSEDGALQDTAILGPMEEQTPPERHYNIHTSPEVMAGVYANFANVSHSDYEFTITFARVDHEVEEAEVPGVVVSRVNVSPRLIQELSDALQDNISRWQAREGIRDLPETGDDTPDPPT